ncbi:acyltransferase family protein [Rhizosphaericola mali]|uniref:Acyltransferase n=1 Tax=Rhizosphaericola mali TaxID=2545455 RepID=A0A5P2G4Y7_9BACT|nr:acyltransferase [Rhizosphaericola mali]QES90257.1 acyltransferase [Rhizosphaericola mali]
MSQNTLAPKQHYVLLDGLRGIAAISVVIFHFMEMMITDYEKIFIAHGFLAVDFFFCLSGFVVAYSYDDRIQSMGLKTFFRSRLIRLHPLVVIGTILGLIALIVDPFSNEFHTFNLGQIILLFIASILVIPLPIMKDRAFNLFGLNAPEWSLFWEYIANILYALILFKLSKKIIVVLMAIFAIALCHATARAGNIAGGWGKDTFWDGGIRLGFSFSMGMLIYRYKLSIKNNFGFLIFAILLFLMMISPFSKMNYILEPIIVILIFPIIIMMGIGSKYATKSSKFIKLLGNISYPLYMTHYAFIWIFNHYYTKVKPENSTVAIVIITTIIVMLAIAYVTMQYVDGPIRKYLTTKFKK